MGSTIAVDDAVKSNLDRLKREGETYNDVLDRLIGATEPIQSGVLTEEEAEEMMDVVRNHREETKNVS